MIRNFGAVTKISDQPQGVLLGKGTGGDALAGDIITGKKATVDSGQVTGTLALTGDAIVGDVITGKKFYSLDPKSQLTGTLSLTGTAADANVLLNKTYYNTDAKTKRTGAMPDHSADALVLTVSTLDQVLSGLGYWGNTSASVKFKGEPNLAAANIKQGVVIGLYTGTLPDGTGLKKVASGQATVVANMITVSGLTFQPSVIHAYSTITYQTGFLYNASRSTVNFLRLTSTSVGDIAVNSGGGYINATGFKLYTAPISDVCNWIAYE